MKKKRDFRRHVFVFDNKICQTIKTILKCHRGMR